MNARVAAAVDAPVLMVLDAPSDLTLEARLVSVVQHAMAQMDHSVAEIYHACMIYTGVVQSGVLPVCIAQAYESVLALKQLIVMSSMYHCAGQAEVYFLSMLL